MPRGCRRVSLVCILCLKTLLLGSRACLRRNNFPLAASTTPTWTVHDFLGDVVPMLGAVCGLYDVLYKYYPAGFVKFGQLCALRSVRWS